MTKTRCSFINAASVRSRGNGPITQTATASLSALDTERRPNRAATNANTPQVTSGSGLVRAIVSTLITMTPDFRVGVASMNPITCKEPISERRDNTCANRNRNESRSVHTYLPNPQGLYANEVLYRFVTDHLISTMCKQKAYTSQGLTCASTI